MIAEIAGTKLRAQKANQATTQAIQNQCKAVMKNGLCQELPGSFQDAALLDEYHWQVRSPGNWADASIGQGGPDHCQSFTVYFHCTTLKSKVTL